ncbi:MAG: energy-coupling factor ABC transporter ATP-binding protein, partial [Actinomycetota bacterium]|nr:energy-coupling factor ABC transporter ATP-binding protein [Actinomycetota bacterium]
PRFLVLDEPTSGLDARGKAAIFDCLDRLNNEGVAILMVTHSMDEVAESARRIIVLNEGKIVLDDKPARIFAHASFLREIGLDIPKAAELVLKLREKGFDIEPDGVSVRSVVDNVAAAVKARCTN